jgi:hypothetical protein
VREHRLLHVHRLDAQAEAAAQLDGRGGDRPRARGGGLDRALGAAGQLGGLGAKGVGGGGEPARGELQVLRARRRGVREKLGGVVIWRSGQTLTSIAAIGVERRDVGHDPRRAAASMEVGLLAVSRERAAPRLEPGQVAKPRRSVLAKLGGERGRFHILSEMSRASG